MQDRNGARVVLGLPLYNDADHLPQALESLRSQTFGEFALLVVDDGSSDGSAAIARRYAEGDQRMTVRANERRLGLAGNWRRTLDLAHQLHPGAEWFAWVSGHDVWEPRWLEALLAALREWPEAVGAYPQNTRISSTDAPLPEPWRFEAIGIDDPGERMAAVTRGMRAGDMVYGLFRIDALLLEPFLPVLLPDRLLLARLALRGDLVQVPEVLWHRRFDHAVTAARQRAASFPWGAPAWSYLPWWLQHASVLARAESPGLAAAYIRISLPLAATGQAGFLGTWVGRGMARPAHTPLGFSVRALRVAARGLQRLR